MLTEYSFADAYDLFAVNFVNILLGYVYYPDTKVLPDIADLYIKLASGVGTVIGQISFGVMIDLNIRTQKRSPILCISDV